MLHRLIAHDRFGRCRDVDGQVHDLAALHVHAHVLHDFGRFDALPSDERQRFFNGSGRRFVFKIALKRADAARDGVQGRVEFVRDEARHGAHDTHLLKKFFLPLGFPRRSDGFALLAHGVFELCGSLSNKRAAAPAVKHETSDKKRECEEPRPVALDKVRNTSDAQVLVGTALQVAVEFVNRNEVGHNRPGEALARRRHA